MNAGIREIKNHLSEYLKRVKQGEIVVITERNVPVARLAPIQEEIQPEILALVKERAASWQGGKPYGTAVPPEIPGIASIAALVAEDRR
jgi:prevent-host-death family protein